jgi:hypothetical protein
MKTVKVSQLKKGDELVSGGRLFSEVTFIGDHCGQKNRAVVSIVYPNEKESQQIWGYNTQVKIKA